MKNTLKYFSFVFFLPFFHPAIFFALLKKSIFICWSIYWKKKYFQRYLPTYLPTYLALYFVSGESCGVKTDIFSKPLKEEIDKQMVAFSAYFPLILLFRRNLLFVVRRTYCCYCLLHFLGLKYKRFQKLYFLFFSLPEWSRRVFDERYIILLLIIPLNNLHYFSL